MVSLEILNYLDEDIEDYIADSQQCGHIHLLGTPNNFVLLKDLLMWSLKQLFTRLKTKDYFAPSLFFKKICRKLQIWKFHLKKKVKSS